MKNIGELNITRLMSGGVNGQVKTVLSARGHELKLRIFDLLMVLAKLLF